jgi:hypothetical protein
MPRSPCALLLALILAVPPGASAHVSAPTPLSDTQVKVIAGQIAALHSSAERGLSNDWVPAKKAAEFLCRPLALDALKTKVADADRVFLGDNDPATLRLVSAERLEGSGSVRAGSDWLTFQFTCVMNPTTGKATRFDVKF